MMQAILLSSRCSAMSLNDLHMRCNEMVKRNLSFYFKNFSNKFSRSQWRSSGYWVSEADIRVRCRIQFVY